MKDRIGGDVISILCRDPDALQKLLKEKLDIAPERIDNLLRIEQSRGHEFVPRIIEAAPQMVDSISVGKPTLEDVFIPPDRPADLKSRRRFPRRRWGSLARPPGRPVFRITPPRRFLHSPPCLCD